MNFWFCYKPFTYFFLFNKYFHSLLNLRGIHQEISNGFCFFLLDINLLDPTATEEEVVVVEDYGLTGGYGAFGFVEGDEE